MKRGFTLIELLVVITIIVVLLALLTPALDQAIYQAELTICAANQRAVAGGSQLYAAQGRRFYPQPPTPRPDVDTLPPMIGLELGVNTNDPEADIEMRPVLANHVSMKMFVCPLAPGQLDFSLEATDDDAQVFVNYAYFAGYKYNGVMGGRGMLRLGDRLGFVDDAFGTQSVRVSSGVLVQDWSEIKDSGARVIVHPDSLGVFTPSVWENEPYTLAEVGPVGVGQKVYGTRYKGWSEGRVDKNATFSDGAAVRYNDLEMYYDPRMTMAPWSTNGSDASPRWRQLVPK